MEMLIDEVLKGNTAILIDGMAKAMIVSSKNLPGARGIRGGNRSVCQRFQGKLYGIFQGEYRADSAADQRYTAEEPADDHRCPFKNRCGVDVYGGSGRPEMLKQVSESWRVSKLTRSLTAVIWNP